MIVCVFDHVQWKFVRNDGLTRGYQALEGSDDEFWLAARPNGYQHTGLFNEWNISDHRRPARGI